MAYPNSRVQPASSTVGPGVVGRASDEIEATWPEDSAVVALNRFISLVDDKAWEHLGITGEEFRRLWNGGAFRGWADPAVVALDRLMRTGAWGRL